MSKERKERGFVSVVVALSFIACLTTMLSMVPPAPAQFVIAAWDYPDQYGQGIASVKPQENSTGTWLDVPSIGIIYNTDAGFEWNVSLSLRLIFVVEINKTLTGASSLADGQNYHRENISVYDRRSNLVFSQNNLTYEAGYYYGDIYQYLYSVILEFEFLEGEAYQVLCTCEIYYLEE